MNGVCVKWIGWMDLDSLVGKAKLLFDEERAKVSESCMAGSVRGSLLVLVDPISQVERKLWYMLNVRGIAMATKVLYIVSTATKLLSTTTTHSECIFTIVIHCC